MASHPLLPSRATTGVLTVARICMASLYLFSGLEKLIDYRGAVGFAGAFGVPLARYAIALAIVLELGCAAALLVPRYCRYGAAILIPWTLILGVWFHPFWAVPPAAWQMMVDDFFHHFVMAGGLAYVVVFGAGSNRDR